MLIILTGKDVQNRKAKDQNIKEELLKREDLGQNSKESQSLIITDREVGHLNQVSTINKT